jgi:hypothetical protein
MSSVWHVVKNNSPLPTLLLSEAAGGTGLLIPGVWLAGFAMEPRDKRGAIVDLKLPEDVLEMGADGPATDAQRGRDGAVGQAVHHARCDLDFAMR